MGRRLRRLLLEAGLVGPHTVALPVTTDDVAPGAFIETFLAPKARVIDPDLLDGASVQSAWAELSEWASRGTGFGYALGLMAGARKPDDWASRART